jgi:hypothetical protein
MRLAITGHRGLPDSTEQLVAAELRRAVAEHADGELVGLSCLADGADTLFAEAVLDECGTLIAIVPAVEYRDGLPESHHPVYDRLLRGAFDVIRLDHVESTSESHMDASVRMLTDADVLVAVWDGQPALGYGGTADVVAAARDRNVPVTVIWPPDAERE